MEKDLIVETPIDCVADGGKRHHMSVEIGRPQPVGEDFQCHWAIRGLNNFTAPVVGGDAIQSITRALAMVRSSLGVLEDKGYRITFPGEEEAAGIDAIWFGHLDRTRKRPRTKKSRVRLRHP